MLDMNARSIGSHDLLLRHPGHPALRRGRRARRGRADPEPGAGAARRALGASGTRRAASPTPRTRHSSPASCPPRRRPGRTRGLFAARVPRQRDDDAEAPGCSTRRTCPPASPAAGYHTVCVGGVGFFNKLTRSARCCRALFAESHWAPEFGVTDPALAANQLDRVERDRRPRPGRPPLFLFLNVSALHQPNRLLPARGRGRHDRRRHAAALRLRRPPHRPAVRGS